MSFNFGWQDCNCTNSCRRHLVLETSNYVRQASLIMTNSQITLPGSDSNKSRKSSESFFSYFIVGTYCKNCSTMMTPIRAYILAVSVIVLSILVVYILGGSSINLLEHLDEKKQSVIFTCSTFFEKKDKFDQFIKAMDSIQDADRALIDNFVVINEYGPDYDDNDAKNHAQAIKTRYPFIHYIQKGANDRGQARTLNMILSRIGTFDYWIHWEESWIAKDIFVAKCLDVMNRGDTSLSQLQLTFPDWRDVAPERIIPRDGFMIILLDKMYASLDHGVDKIYEIWSQHSLDIIWPLYSLRPSINRVAHVQRLHGFDEDPDLWPIKFEYEFGVRWIDVGCSKGIIEPSVVFRQDGHVSTYS